MPDNENLIKLQKFMLLNKRIKKELFNMCPPDYTMSISEDSLIKYTDKVYKSLNNVFNDLISIYNDFFYNVEILNEIEIFKNKVIKEFMKCGTDLYALRYFYKNYVSDMKVNFINNLKRECVGYSFYSQAFPMGSFKMVTTINELLHLMHSSIMNNEYNYQNNNVINEKENDNGYKIKLYGTNDELAKFIFKMFPLQLNCGYTDIVSLSNNKVIMMIRDKGHALTIDVERIENSYRIEYFIPKLCNIEMINKLPGVKQVTEGDYGTRGVFETDNLQVDLFDFIECVPTDEDIPEFQNFKKS